MSAVWKIDMKNRGACLSLGKTLSRIHPDFSSFIEENLSSDSNSLTSNEVYDFLLELLSASFQEIAALQVAYGNANEEAKQYQKALQEEQTKRLTIEKTLKNNQAGKNVRINQDLPIKSEPEQKISDSKYLDVMHKNVEK